MDIGKNIKVARQNAGLTQKELAKRLGVKQQTIAMFENNKTNIKFYTLQKIADALEIPVDELYPFAALHKSGTYKLVTEQNTKRLLNNFELLNQIGQQEAIKRVGELTEIPKYKK